MSQPSSQPRARLGKTLAFVPRRCPDIHVQAHLGKEGRVTMSVLSVVPLERSSRGFRVTRSADGSRE